MIDAVTTTTQLVRHSAIPVRWIVLTDAMEFWTHGVMLVFNPTATLAAIIAASWYPS